MTKETIIESLCQLYMGLVENENYYEAWEVYKQLIAHGEVN